MVKCLIRIRTKVNVHLRMINHCYRDVKVRVLSLGPHMLGKALGVLPLYPALDGQGEHSQTLPGIPTDMEPLHDSGHTVCLGEPDTQFEYQMTDSSGKGMLHNPLSGLPITQQTYSTSEDQESEADPCYSEEALSPGKMGHVNKFASKLLCLFSITTGLLFFLLLSIFVLSETDLDFEFLQDIRLSPEYQQFHYEYFCPFRRWCSCNFRWLCSHLINKSNGSE